MANGNKLDAKEKENKAKNPQNPKDQHVPSKGHVQEKKNLIQSQIKRPQRLKIKNAKILWIPKLLNEAMNLKERFTMISNLANPKASTSILGPYIPKSTILNPLSPSSILGPYAPNSTILHPSSPSSILGPYIPKFKPSPTYPPTFPPFHHPSRCVPMTILPPPSTHSLVFQPSIHQTCLPPTHSTPLIQTFS